MTKYKFYITHDSTTYEVKPLYDKIKLSWTKDGVRYREKLTTEFKFVNISKDSISDFSTLLAIENGADRCDEIIFVLKESCDRGATYSTRWTGTFSINDGKFDLDKCVYTLSVPNIQDKYSCILKKINIDYNIVLSGPLIDIRNYERTELQFMYCPLNYADLAPDPTPSGTIYYQSPICLPGFPAASSEEATWSYLYSDIVDLGVGDWHGTIIIYKRYVVTTFNIGGVSNPPANPIFGQYWEITGSNNGVSTQFALEFFSNPNFVATYGTDITSVNCGVVPASPFNLTGVKIIDCVNGKDWYYIQSGTSYINYTQFRTLYNSVVYIVNEICPTINDIVSDFFEWNPIGDAPDYVAGKNYVTDSLNVISNIAIAQKSDIVDPTATQPATKGMISLKSLMENLLNLVNVDWFIDANNNFRIEHSKYFDYTVGYDSTTGVHEPWNIKNKSYSYKKESMPSKEKFSCMESFYVDFIGKDIIYSSECVTSSGDNNTKPFNVDKITTDIDFIESFPDQIDKVGFVLVVFNQDSGVNVVSKELGKLSGAMQNNAHLSWANLHYNYHRYGRVLLEGNMNGITETFFTANRNKVQSNVKLQMCCGERFDPTGILVETELGNGEIETAEQVDDIVTLQINI